MAHLGEMINEPNCKGRTQHVRPLLYVGPCVARAMTGPGTKSRAGMQGAAPLAPRAAPRPRYPSRPTVSSPLPSTSTRTLWPGRISPETKDRAMRVSSLLWR